jgi:hypothetical protein
MAPAGAGNFTFWFDVAVAAGFADKLRQDASLVSIRSWPEFIGETSGYSYIKPKGEIAGGVMEILHVGGIAARMAPAGAGNFTFWFDVAVAAGAPIPGQPQLMVDMEQARSMLHRQDASLVSIRSWPNQGQEPLCRAYRAQPADRHLTTPSSRHREGAHPSRLILARRSPASRS